MQGVGLDGVNPLIGETPKQASLERVPVLRAQLFDFPPESRSQHDRPPVGWFGQRLQVENRNDFGIDAGSVGHPLSQIIRIGKAFPRPGKRRQIGPDAVKFLAEDGGEMLDVPLVVLVNNGTASAAEILAGAIQDHDVGLVAGVAAGLAQVCRIRPVPRRALVTAVVATYALVAGG